MWSILCMKDSEATSKTLDSRDKSSSSVSFLHPLSKVVDREHLSASCSAAELNRVRDSDNTKSSMKTAVAMDGLVWEAHLEKNLHEKGTLFLIKLPHCVKRG
jgi:hypothetical protein